MCMEYALLQKNAVHNLTMWRSAYMVVMLVKANKTNYLISLHPCMEDWRDTGIATPVMLLT